MVTPIYRPRMAALMTVPTAGKRAERIAQEGREDSGVPIPLKVRRASLELNDHNHADTLYLTLDWKNVGIDPRLVRNATVTFFLANADALGHWDPSPSNARFAGLVNRVRRSAGEDEPYTVELESHDYTSLFLKAKPFGSSGIPDYSQTLEEAWRRVVSQTPGAGVLAERLEFRGLDDVPSLQDVVPSRFAKLAKVPTKPETDAWAVWQQTVGMLGLISFMELDRCVVTTSTAYWTDKDPPVLLFGRNLSYLTEERDPEAFDKGVAMTSFDPLCGRVIEARFPPRQDKRVKRKRISAHEAAARAATETVDKYDYFSFPGITDVDTLRQICQRAWEERSRQELQGTATTSDMVVETAGGAKFDLLELRAGDNVQIALQDDARDQLLSLASRSERIDYLISQGYEPQPSETIADSVDDLALLDQQFFVKRIRHNLETFETDGSYETEVTFANRILVDGSASTDGESP